MHVVKNLGHVLQHLYFISHE